MPQGVRAGARIEAGLGRGWKVRPYVPLPAGRTLVLADLAGPGVIRQIFLTTNAAQLRTLVLRCTWDEAPTPAVESPMGDFFAIGQDDANFFVLGGNQSNAVTIARVAKSRLIGARWPATFPRRPQRLLTMKPGEFLTTTNEI